MKSLIFLAVTVIIAFAGSSAVADPRYQTQNDHSGGILSEVTCSQYVMRRWSELDVDRNGQLDRVEFIASAVKARPMELAIDTLNHEGPF